MRNILLIMLVLIISTICFGDITKSMLTANFIKIIQKEDLLPDGLIEVEYLESDGNAYIDTLKYPNTDFIYEGQFAYVGELLNGSQYICGVLNPTGENGVFLLRLLNNGIFSISCAEYSNIYLDIYSTEILPFTISSGNSHYRNVSSPLIFLSNVTISQTLLLFARKAGNGRAYNITAGMRIKSFSILQQNNIKILDLISIRFIDEYGQNIGAMYDKVSNSLFTNQGTGNFIIGPDKY